MNRKIPINGWFLNSSHSIISKDSRRHIDYILDKIHPVKEKIDELINLGAKIEISCFWRTKQGHGGPILSVEQFQRLAEIKIDLFYDFYC